MAEFEVSSELVSRVNNSISYGFTEVNRNEESFIS